MGKVLLLGKMGISTMDNGIKKGKKDLKYWELNTKRVNLFLRELKVDLLISKKYINFDRICGVGVSVWSDGRRYEGEWYNNCMHGKGIYTWPDGRKYEGEYNYDKKHGYGILTWTDNRRFEGYFV